MQTLSHKRAIQWLDHLASIKTGEAPDTQLKNTKDNLRTLPTLILRHGLALAVVTGLASAPLAKKPDWKKLNLWLLKWLEEQFPLGTSEEQDENAGNHDFTEFVTQSTEAHGLARYAALTQEALLFLEWGKQIITAEVSKPAASASNGDEADHTDTSGTAETHPEQTT